MNEQTIESAPLAVSNVTPLAPREAAAVPAFFGHMRPAEKIAYATVWPTRSSPSSRRRSSYIG